MKAISNVYVFEFAFEVEVVLRIGNIAAIYATGPVYFAFAGWYIPLHANRVICIYLDFLYKPLLLPFQVFDNAFAQLEKAWKGNTYAGFGTEIYRVPHSSDATDFVTDAKYAEGRDFLAKALTGAPSELVREYKTIMEHFSSSFYRWEFGPCQKTGCLVCPSPRFPDSPLQRFYEKFGGVMPTLIPFWGRFPEKNSGLPVRHSVPVIPEGGKPQSSGFHYRVLSDMLKMNIPGRLMYPDQHYEGPSGRHDCPTCAPQISYRSAAAFKRHMWMIHSRR